MKKIAMKICSKCIEIHWNALECISWNVLECISYFFGKNYHKILTRGFALIMIKIIKLMKSKNLKNFLTSGRKRVRQASLSWQNPREGLKNPYPQRRTHRLLPWRFFCVCFSVRKLSRLCGGLNARQVFVAGFFSPCSLFFSSFSYSK